MRSQLRKAVNAALNKVGFEVIAAGSQSDAFLLHRLSSIRTHIIHLNPQAREFLQFSLDKESSSCSQILQDLFVLYFLKEKKGGFFVDFGATDGVELSNSFLLENSYNWSGIVAEPSRHFHDALRKNRSCIIDYRCVSIASGDTVAFNEVTGSGLSSMADFAEDDWHGDDRRNSIQYNVETVSLNELLIQHAAPEDIDYLSIDTEGSELSILSSLDFSRFLPKIITVEHNFVDEKRYAIYRLLSENGYVRKFETLSMFDDWYVHSSIDAARGT